MENQRALTNPFRKVGLLHNEGLDSVINNLSPDNVDVEKVLAQTSKYLLEIDESSKKLDFALHYAATGTAVNGVEQIPFAEMMKTAEMSEKAICFMQAMDNISEDTGYEATLKIIENTEANILASDLSEEERKFTLMYAAVAKASVEYWIVQLADKKSAWAPFIEGGDIAARQWPWKKDARGAVTGAIGGLITGGGVILGAIGGAIGASVAGWLFSRK